MSDPRLTEERLRHHLDGNQPMRESMCLALLPLLGPFTRERPRRPKGGADQGRDIEALYNGDRVIWGAVGFRNGGGNDGEARNDAMGKFNDDLSRALEENPALPGFVFFTNVDLTIGQKEELTRTAQTRGPSIVEIFDLNILRNTLDSPEGLIARVQYLNIPMDPTEQAGLVAKFGTQLQSAVTARFDRVERTLGQMERFLDLQKPLLRLDAFLPLVGATTSIQLGVEAVLLRIVGLHDIAKELQLLLVTMPSHPLATRAIVAQAHFWLPDAPEKIISMRPHMSGFPNAIEAASELSLTFGGNRVSLADATVVEVSAICTERLRSRVTSVMIDGNGYELFSVRADGIGYAVSPTLNGALAEPLFGRKWVALLDSHSRNLLEQPPEKSARFGPITKIATTRPPTAIGGVEST